MLQKGDKTTLGTLKKISPGFMGMPPHGYREEEKRESEVLVCHTMEKRNGSLIKHGKENALVKN